MFCISGFVGIKCKASKNKGCLSLYHTFLIICNKCNKGAIMYQVVVSNVFMFSPIWGNDQNLTNIFQMDGNHQLVLICRIHSFTS